MGYVYETWDECISVEFLGESDGPEEQLERLRANA